MREKSQKLVVQQRDIDIFNFLERVGYANLKHIGQWLGDSSEKYLNAVMRRLYLLRRFDYLKVFHTHLGNYYALTKQSRIQNELVNTIKLDQLPHHDFLIDLFMVVKNHNVMTEREVRARKEFGSQGKIPDMLIEDWVIEYERTNKSNVDCKAVVNYWMVDNNRKLCIIYATEEIKARYERINPGILLVSKLDYTNIMNKLKNNKAEQSYGGKSLLEKYQ